jgi:ribose 5-phosphate isomerase A
MLGFLDRLDLDSGTECLMANASEPAKLQAAAAAASLVESGMTVGLGSGTTAADMVRFLGRRVEDEGLRFVGVSTSKATAELARALGIPLRDLDDVHLLDLNLDGADEIDGAFRMIKGRGGALLREKLVVDAARRRVTIITADKRVEHLGEKMPIPVEVSPFGMRHVDQHLREIGATTELRMDGQGGPYVTDGGNRIIDCRFPRIEDPEALEHRLKQIVGVFETGLFVGLCDLIVVGHPDRVEMVAREVQS